MARGSGRRGGADPEMRASGLSGALGPVSERFGALRDWISGRPIFQAERWRDWAEDQPRTPLKDVIVDPRVPPATAVLLTLLVALISYLTYEYAACGVEPKPEACRDAGGVIPVAWGYWTVLGVALLALTAGFQPLVSPPLARWLRGARWRRALAALVAWPVGLIAGSLSVAWSLIDWAMAKGVAVAAGATWSDWRLRYGHGGAMIGACVAAALAAPPPIAIPAGLAGVLIILAIARRWSWVEADREVFLAAQRSRAPAPEGAARPGRRLIRIGFGEDLRDEALCGIVCLFLLAPLLLRQVDIAFDAYDLAPAATVEPTAFQTSGFCRALDRAATPGETEGVCDWLGFFGGELAKSVPLVDWSEVFEVQNESPIKATKTEGSALVFLLRLGLDLLLLASLALALRVAGAVATRTRAFSQGVLTTIDPFAERAWFRPVAIDLAAERDGDPRIAARPALWRATASLAHYAPRRLEEIAAGGAGALERVEKPAAGAPSDAAPEIEGGRAEDGKVVR
ncbi:MAG: hypothetical protein AAFR16_02010, partial [Pseudomonadota bacterium]